MTEESSSNRYEKKSLSLAALILALIGLTCAFLHGWRITGMVLSIFALVVSIYSINKSKATGKHNVLTIPAIIAAIIGTLVSAYFIFVMPRLEYPPGNEHRIPQELTDSASIRDQDQSKDLLKNIIDTSQAE